VACLGDNFLNKNLQTTFKALLSTNSMSTRLFGAPLRPQARNAVKDRFLGTYIALDMYYAKLMAIDFSTVPLPEVIPEQPAPQNPQTPPSATK